VWLLFGLAAVTFAALFAVTAPSRSMSRNRFVVF
jgi:hypothetical protein